MNTKTRAEPTEVPPLVNIVGEQIALGPLRKNLFSTYVRWYNDLHMLRALGGTPRPLTLEQQGHWYESAIMGSEARVVFTVFEKSTGRSVGQTGLHGIDYRNRNAEFTITIGEPDARGRGYGTEATRLMLDYAFTALGLHNVMLRVFSFNVAGIRTYAKAGFKEFGRRRECYLMGGTTWDVIYMECLASEWGPSPLLAEVFKPDEVR